MYNKRETKLFLINSCEEIKLLGYEKDILSTGTISFWTILFTSMLHRTLIQREMFCFLNVLIILRIFRSNLNDFYICSKEVASSVGTGERLVAPIWNCIWWNWLKSRRLDGIRTFSSNSNHRNSFFYLYCLWFKPHTNIPATIAHIHIWEGRKGDGILR